MLDEAMLSSGLVTPKKRFLEIDPTIEQSPLLESPRLKRIVAAYKEVGDTPQFGDTIEAVTAVGSLVRHTLNFASLNASGIPRLKPEELQENPVTNCYGYTVVASEILDKIGIEHYISVANEHAFIVVFKPHSDKAFMLSVADKELYTDITDVIGSQHPLDQLATGELFAENEFDSQRLAEKIEDEDVRKELFAKRPWLHFESEHKSRFAEPKPRDFKPVMRTYPSYPGRGIIKEYFEFLYQTHKGDAAAAVEAAENLEGVFPEVDPRNNMRDARLLLNRLEAERRYDDMLALSGAIDASLGAAESTKNAFFHPDTTRRVGMRTNDPELVAEAIAQYEGIPTGGNLRQAKIRKGRHLLRILSRNTRES